MKNDPSFDLTKLKKELERIKSSISCIYELVYDDSRSTKVRDRYGSDINIGDRIEFLTKGKYVSKEGVVVMIATNGSRVISKDVNNNIIPRAPKNLKVKNSVSNDIQLTH